MQARTLLLAVASISLLGACGGPDQPPAAPANATAPSTTTVTTVRTDSTASAVTPAPAGDLLAQLKKSKVTIAQGVAQVEKENGAAISAKFELEDGKLSLSVYTAKPGLEKDAEHNVLMEHAGDPTQDKWAPKTETFADKEHITRASMHLTLVQRAKTTLGAVIAKASAAQPGTVYSVIPAVKDKKPVFDVLVLTPEGKSVPLTL